MKSLVRKPRVLMLLIEYAPIFSGHGVYLQHLIKKLQNLDCQISILTADFHKFSRQETIDDIKVFRFHFSPQDSRWELKLTFQILNFLIKNVHKYDILHINGHLDFYASLTLFNKFFKKHTIMQMVLLGADDPLSLMNSYKFMRFRFRVLSLMDRFLCISRVIGDSYKQAGLPMEKLAYIPQGVDLEKFHPISNGKKTRLKERLDLPLHRKIVIFIGTVVKRKGIDWLINAWEKVQDKYPDALLVIVGQHTFGEDDVNRKILNHFVEMINNQIKKNGSNVLFTGRKNNVEEYLQCADLFVLPSRKEGFGNVILEAMACSLPVVVTYMDGVSSETVTHGINGFIAHKPVELEKLILKILGDDEIAKEMGEAGMNKAISSFDINKIAEEYASLYKIIIQ